MTYYLVQPIVQVGRYDASSERMNGKNCQGTSLTLHFEWWSSLLQDSPKSDLKIRGGAIRSESDTCFEESLTSTWIIPASE